MLKIRDDGLTRSGTRCFVYSCTHKATARVKALTWRCEVKFIWSQSHFTNISTQSCEYYCDTEDVLSSRVSHYWSPDSRLICYAELNDTGVPLQTWPWYGHKSHVYVQTMRVAYPKVSWSSLKSTGWPTKSKPQTIVHIFARYWPILKIFSPAHSLENL